MVVSAPAFKDVLIPHLAGAVVQKVKCEPAVERPSPKPERSRGIGM
ncbi:hypothetical protein SAMN00120144_4014 [Hymenobacter roseosalivarius DSM 11622]|uniref:Uncharacterized protein n=1 Tax=Hymenobacter roseosalivarius DSM 11622 TaxID=645990 RepID=A0A1W1UHL5_9BACT|nr:hypothetical protein [Hymenobacter roseosalivarius]SMB80595.1 hypothetical protein SAMN00120144_4014 [Hymenobacter roseosalivarius DSM 11622]